MNEGLLVRALRYAQAALGATATDVLRTTAPVAPSFFQGRVQPRVAGALRVTVSLAGGSVFRLATYTAATGGTPKLADFNAGTALGATQLNAFVFSAHPDLFYDFQLGSDVAIDLLQVEEAWLGTP